MSSHLLLTFTSSLLWHLPSTLRPLQYDKYLKRRARANHFIFSTARPPMKFRNSIGSLQLKLHKYIYNNLVSYTLHWRAGVSIPYKSAPAYTFRSQGCIIAICIGVTGVHLITQCHSCIENKHENLRLQANTQSYM